MTAIVVFMFEKIEKEKSLYGGKSIWFIKVSRIIWRRKKLLEQVSSDKKYSSIAAETNQAEGTIKNKMRKIFKKIGYADRISLLADYGGCKIR